MTLLMTKTPFLVHEPLFIHTNRAHVYTTMKKATLKSLIKEVLKEVKFSQPTSREKMKQAIRTIVLKEITMANFGTGKVSTNDGLAADVKKAVGKTGEVIQNPLNNKVVVDDKENGKKYQVEITECGDDLYDVNVITHGSDRKTGRQLSAEKLAEFLKASVEDKGSAVEKARAKSMNALGRNEEKDEKVEEKRDKKDEKDGDEMVDTKEPTQKEIGDKATKKADEKVDKEVAPIDDEVAPQLGGELVDKIEKIIDRVLSGKANKKSELKADSANESPDKRVVKLKDTPSLKGTDKPIGKPLPAKNKEK
jgi:hypothetical protein